MSKFYDLEDTDKYNYVPPCVTPISDSALNPGQATIYGGPDFSEKGKGHESHYSHDTDDPTPEY